MKDRRSVALSLAIIAAFYFFRSGYAYWVLVKIIPIAEVFDLPYSDPANTERFAHNLHFSIALFGALGLAGGATSIGVVLRQHWTRWLWIVTCTVSSFSYVYNLLVAPSVATKQYDVMFVCVVSWVLLGGNGLRRTSAP